MAAQDYEHPAWEQYDRAYWDKAVATRNKKRSQVDTALFNQMFTGRARSFTPNNPKQDTFTESSSIARKWQNPDPLFTPSSGLSPKLVRANEDTVFGLFNKGNCTFKHCKFHHDCSIRGCGGTTSPEATHLHTEVVS